MYYPKLVFPNKSDRPFFYTNFVSTVDGKVGVKKNGYWPIGSKLDHQVLIELRSYADCLLHGKNLANQSYITVSTRNLEKLSVEGYLSPKKAIKKLSLLSVKKAENELFLHYKVKE